MNNVCVCDNSVNMNNNELWEVYFHWGRSWSVRNLPSTKPISSWVRSTFNSPGVLLLTGSITFCTLLTVPHIQSRQEGRQCGEELLNIRQIQSTRTVLVWYELTCEQVRWTGQAHARGHMSDLNTPTSLSAHVICFPYGCQNKANASV